ncbi:YncE family protein [Methylomonas koyamae]|nr:YncE family protein [Methylomonas koyamae]
MKINYLFLLFLLESLLLSTTASAEMLAMLNYETEPQQPRQEGIAIMDVDPSSAHFGEIVDHVSLPTDGVSHHIFYNKTLDKAYITSLGNGALRVMKMRQTPLNPKDIDVPACQVAEDIIFSEDGKLWYMTCMGSSNVIVGDAHTDKVVKVITSKDAKHFIQNPHGIGLHQAIDRLLVTSTIKPDLTEPGNTVTEIQASTGEIVATHKVSGPDFQGGSGPVEAVFIPHSNPAQAYINTMFEGRLWLASWQHQIKQFQLKPVFNFADVKQGMPLEIYFSHDHKKLFVTTAKPGALNIFDISTSPEKPRLIKSISTAGGAHHVVISPDERFAIVQNNFLNLPEMNDGSITVIDLHKMETIATINTLKDKGWKANSILMMPQWHTDDAH